MSYHRRTTGTNQGFTIVELVITLLLLSIVTTVAYTFFNTTLTRYLGLQRNSSAFTDLASQSQRIANVLRGSTDIISFSTNDLTVYAYFFPNNNYVSQVRYYLNPTKTVLYADVTPMSTNPPLGTPVTANKKTYTIIRNFYQPSGTNLFTYLDSGGNAMTMPIADQHTIKGVRINLAVPADNPTPNAAQSLSLTVSLRNRKTNL